MQVNIYLPRHNLQQSPGFLNYHNMGILKVLALLPGLIKKKHCLQQMTLAMREREWTCAVDK
jgi:hypothetical protein